ncbi:MAG: cell envelope integrity protein CreD [Dysgonamonadaceae bacterium]|nr:cell envelope integrity protein CreD [Dysgonamonadaceae bacterium]
MRYLEDVALLIGSTGLFIILGIIMYVSQRIKWYKPEE